MRVHPREYVEQVREFSRAGRAFDMDTPTSAGSYEAALRAAGGACALVESLLSGGERTGFSALRPPGHHAEWSTAMGFCLFANVAIAARHALDALGAERVLVLDWDVHHGNGTNAIFHGSPRGAVREHPPVPVLARDAARSTTWGRATPRATRSTCPCRRARARRPSCPCSSTSSRPLHGSTAPDLILISAGYDAHRDDPLGGLSLETSSYGGLSARMRALGEELGAPVGAVLEGGYDLHALATSVAETMSALANGATPVEVARHPLADEAAGVLGPLLGALNELCVGARVALGQLPGLLPERPRAW